MAMPMQEDHECNMMDYTGRAMRPSSAAYQGALTEDDLGKMISVPRGENVRMVDKPPPSQSMDADSENTSL